MSPCNLILFCIKVSSWHTYIFTSSLKISTFTSLFSPILIGSLVLEPQEPLGNLIGPQLWVKFLMGSKNYV